MNIKLLVILKLPIIFYQVLLCSENSNGLKRTISFLFFFSFYSKILQCPGIFVYSFTFLAHYAFLTDHFTELFLLDFLYSHLLHHSCANPWFSFFSISIYKQNLSIYLFASPSLSPVTSHLFIHTK